MTFEARYESWCPECGERIEVGDECAYDDDDRVVHDWCAD